MSADVPVSIHEHRGDVPEIPKFGNEEQTLEHVILECKKPQDAEYGIQKKVELHRDSTPKIFIGTKKLLKEWDEKYPPTKSREAGVKRKRSHTD